MKRLAICGMVLLLALSYAACEKEEIFAETADETAQEEVNTPTTESQQRTRDEALAIAAGLVKSTSSKNGVRALSDFDVSYILTPPSQKEEYKALGLRAVDTMVFILNEKDGTGFSIISGDKCVPELLAYSDDGHLDLKYVNNPGLSIFLSRLPTFFELERIKERERVKDREIWFKDRGLPVDDGAPALYTYRYTEWQKYYSPRCGEVCWGQDEPFNNKAPMRGGEHAAAGCVATAVAQFLRTHKYPSWFRGQHLDWDFFVKYTNNRWHTPSENEQFNEQVSQLFRSLGDALCNDWGKEESGASFNDVPKLLKRMGFHNVPDRVRNYRFNAILSSLERGRPVFLRGCDEKWTIPILNIPFYKGGHVWLCEGYLLRERYRDCYEIKSKKFVERTKEREHLLYCNWGWEGALNGYFYEGVFNAYRPIDTTKTTPVLHSSTPYYFQYDLKQIADVHP